MGYVTLFLSALSIACGLYCAAEIAEEYSSMSLKIIKGTLGFVGVCHFLCLFSGVGEKKRERWKEIKKERTKLQINPTCSKPLFF